MSWVMVATGLSYVVKDFGISDTPVRVEVRWKRD